MGVIIQNLLGSPHNGHFYPSISGVAQSYNYYPFDSMKPEEGIANISLGLGRAVMEGEKTLRFSPSYPELLPQRSSVDDILNNSQRHFYALRMALPMCILREDEEVTLARREISDAAEELPVKTLASTYVHEEHRVRRDLTRPTTLQPDLPVESRFDASHRILREPRRRGRTAAARERRSAPLAYPEGPRRRDGHTTPGSRRRTAQPDWRDPCP